MSLKNDFQQNFEAAYSAWATKLWMTNMPQDQKNNKYEYEWQNHP